MPKKPKTSEQIQAEKSAEAEEAAEAIEDAEGAATNRSNSSQHVE